MADSWWQVPLHPEDVAHARKEHATASDAMLDARQKAFELESQRLQRVADYKRALERLQRGGPVDSQAAFADATDLAFQDGFPRASELASVRRADESLADSPPSDTRNAALHYLLAPRTAVLNAAKAFSSPGEYGGPQTAAEFAGQLATAIPSAIYPPAGYPTHGAEKAYADYADAYPVTRLAVEAKLLPYEMAWANAPVSAARSGIRGGRNMLERLRYGSPGVETYVQYPGGVETRIRNSYVRDQSPLAPLLLR